MPHWAQCCHYISGALCTSNIELWSIQAALPLIAEASEWSPCLDWCETAQLLDNACLFLGSSRPSTAIPCKGLARYHPQIHAWRLLSTSSTLHLCSPSTASTWSISLVILLIFSFSYQLDLVPGGNPFAPVMADLRPSGQ